MTPAVGRLTEEQEAELVTELREALDDVLRRSGCADMQPLWLVATKKPRAEFLRQEGRVTGVPEHLRRWPGPKRTRYAALAHWRHVVLWRDVLSRLRPECARAIEDLYFTPYARNEPPYAWTKASRRAPGASRYASPTELDDLAKAGCEASIEILLERTEERTIEELARAAFADVRPRLGSLHDVLRTA